MQIFLNDKVEKKYFQLYINHIFYRVEKLKFK